MQNVVSQIYISRKTAAKIAGMSMQWLRRMDSVGIGPPKIRLGQGHGTLRYNVKEYMRWLQSYSEPASVGPGKE